MSWGAFVIVVSCCNKNKIELLLSSTMKENPVDAIQDLGERQVILTRDVSDRVYQFLGQLQEHG